jgi:peptidoglycan-associated lipoprotein
LGFLGVPDTQLESVSFGKEKPTEIGHDEAAWAKNRRAEIAYR